VAVARVSCRAQIGLDAPLVQVEVSLAAGLPTFYIVGLPATVVKESKERVRAALLNSHFEFPAGRITVSLAPAELPKEGGRYDLPIALGVLLASGQVRVAARRHAGEPTREFYGELGLAGELKPVSGLLIAAAHARAQGHELIVPQANAVETCAVAPGLTRAARNLLEVCAHVSGAVLLPLAAAVDGALKRTHGVEVRGPLGGVGSGAHGGAVGGGSTGAVVPLQPAPDLLDVYGQRHAKRALIIAAAGGHSLLFIGPPGTGKSMLAQRLPGLLPPLGQEEALEVAAIAAASVTGCMPGRFGERPFRAPHHSASVVALVGGGARAQPGEISLAHHGVLFLDELPEFARPVLEALREPLESGQIAVARAALRAEYPASFQLIAAMNPCPCGWFGESDGRCKCTRQQIRRYLTRVSGPLLDRLDMHVDVPPLRAADFSASPEEGDSSAAAAVSVARARALQLVRQGTCNARLTDAGVRCWCSLDEPGTGLLERSMRQLRFSGRARQRLLKLARTIADLAGLAVPGADQVAEAIKLRCLDSLDYAADAPDAKAPLTAPGAISTSAPYSRRPA
jgi:magnesium chelatase family protein